MTHASEGGHWYRRDGTPCYEVPYASGEGMRPVNLRDAKKLGLVPGVSGVSRCAAAPALEAWKAKQVLLSALTLPKINGEKDDAYCDRIMEDSRQQGKLAAEKGTAIHAAIQGAYEGQEPAGAFRLYVDAAQRAINEFVTGQQRVWVPERSFACQLGYGGKVDLSCTVAVVDFKTKEFTGADIVGGKQLAWDDHCQQLAAYRVGLNLPTARCANVFVSVNEPGLAIVHEWKEEELQRGWRMFAALLQFWQAKNKYNSSWMPERIAA